jgi:hypothetical protein
MLGCNPGSFLNIKAAKLAGEAYSLEENCRYIIIQKYGHYESLNKITASPYYSVCPYSDLKIAELEGYKYVRDCDGE